MLAPLNNQERQHIASLRAHPLLANVAALSWDDLLALMLQRRFLSLSIVNIYEFVIDALENEAIKATVRLILHEEYPRNTRGVPLASHRELLFRDLLHLGACREQILSSGGGIASKSWGRPPQSCNCRRIRTKGRNCGSWCSSTAPYLRVATAPARSADPGRP